MPLRPHLLVVLLTLPLTACGPAPDGTNEDQDDGAADAATIDDTQTANADAGPLDDTPDAGHDDVTPDAGEIDETPDAGTPPETPDAGPPPPATATLRGEVRRSARAFLSNDDGRGDVYAGLFTSNPVSDPAAIAIARQRISAVDLSSGSKRVAYELTGIPPRTEAYHLSIFLDDDGNVSEAAPAPDPGDSVAMPDVIRQTVPTITIGTASTFTQDVDLNVVRPF